MADRITQLQEETNLLATYMCDSIGVLQNSGVNSDKGKSDIALFSKLISDTSSNINLLIDSLPTEQVSSSNQYTRLLALLKENEDADKELLKTKRQAERQLELIKAASSHIASTQLKIRTELSSKLS
ncbi:mediator of RNA polymerase II transcription subunit 21-like [Bolinopsis microptera]|uniref:mediator of RNA polymerase II transcription subunit 21-like n=1 Tax=Bolinopsis microptera TaxID=2820187 RepID=UPI0030790CE4